MADLLRPRQEDRILMVAHNPGAALLADMLLKAAPDLSEFDRFPTCAALVADFDIENWQQLQRGTGRTAHFIVPRDLID